MQDPDHPPFWWCTALSHRPVYGRLFLTHGRRRGGDGRGGGGGEELAVGTWTGRRTWRRRRRRTACHDVGGAPRRCPLPSCLPTLRRRGGLAGPPFDGRRLPRPRRERTATEGGRPVQGRKVPSRLRLVRAANAFPRFLLLPPTPHPPPPAPVLLSPLPFPFHAKTEGRRVKNLQQTTKSRPSWAATLCKGKKKGEESLEGRVARGGWGQKSGEGHGPGSPPSPPLSCR